jgi:conjugal transfer mating pair stabilization protein TraN
MREAKIQLSLSWGTPQNPDCSGLTPDQLASLDFSTMDLSEFYADINTQLDESTTAMTDRISQRIQGILDTGQTQ